MLYISFLSTYVAAEKKMNLFIEIEEPKKQSLQRLFEKL